MTNLERMKLAAANKPKSSKSPPSIPEPAKVAAPTPKAKSVPDDAATVAFHCGHKVGVKHFAGLDCPGCSHERRKVKIAARKAKKAAFRSTPKLDMGGTEEGRLPDGAEKILRWAGGRWCGAMTVPGCADILRAEAGSERECYHALHMAWMEWMKANEK